MGSLSPMRTSATSSSMSSLLQGRGNGESSSATPPRRGSPLPLPLPSSYSPGWRSRRLGTQVSGGSRTLTSSTRKLSAAVSRTWKGPSWALFCAHSPGNLPSCSLSGTHQSATTLWNPTNLILIVSRSQLSQGSGPQTSVTAHQSHTRPRGLDSQLVPLSCRPQDEGWRAVLLTVAMSAPPDSCERGSDRGLRQQRLHRRPRHREPSG